MEFGQSNMFNDAFVADKIILRRNYTSILRYSSALFQLHMLYSVEWDGKTIINGKKTRIWRGSVVAYFRVLYRH